MSHKGTFAQQVKGGTANLRTSFDSSGKESVRSLSSKNSDNFIQARDNQVITSDSLKQEKPFDLTQQPPQSTAVSGELANIESQSTDNFNKQLQRQKDLSSQGEKQSFTNLLQAEFNAPTQSGLEAKFRGAKGGQDDIQVELDAIDTQLRAEQHALRRQIENTQTEAGLTKGQVNQQVSEIQRVSLRKQADLAVIQQSIQGRFDSAKAIADRAVNAQLEQSQREIDILGLVYNRNKSLFDKSEQRLFETQQADRQRVIEKQAFRERARFDEIIKQRDPLYQLQVLKARKELESFGQKTLKEINAENKALKDAEKAIPSIQNKLNLIHGILGSSAMDSVVGPTILSRASGSPTGLAGRIITPTLAGAGVGSFVPGIGTAIGAGVGLATGLGLASQGAVDIFGERQNFISGVQQLVDKEFLDNLINVKSQGATFGALSDAEGQALRAAATRIGTWAIKDKNGKVLGYNASEDDFKKELNIIRELTKTAYQEASGNLYTEDEQTFFDNLQKESLSGFNPAY